MPIPPSSAQAVAGATVLANLSASNEVIGKASYRKQLVAGQSGRCVAGYVYSSCGVGESTTDLVFGGHCLIAENGTIVAESERFRRGDHLTFTDLDLEHLLHDRVQTNSFNDAPRIRAFRRVAFDLELTAREPKLLRSVEAHPFVPSDPATRDDRCREIFQTQVAALARRLAHIGTPPVSIGISGGLDSTLALLVATKTMDDLGVPRDRVKAFTMPGFGTTSRTKGNAHALMKALGVSVRECDIRQTCFDQMKRRPPPFGIKLEGETVDSPHRKAPAPAT